MSDLRVSARQVGYSRPKCAEARGARAAAKRRVAETILFGVIWVVLIGDSRFGVMGEKTGPGLEDVSGKY